MFRCFFILAASLSFLALPYGEAAAEERVLRLKTGNEPFSPATFAEYPTRIYYSNDTSLNQWTFAVYTTDEVDSRISSVAAAAAQDSKAIAELQGVVDELRKNIKDLADINDALSRRVEELEKKSASITNDCDYDEAPARNPL